MRDTRSSGVGLPTGNNSVYSLLDSQVGSAGCGCFRGFMLVNCSKGGEKGCCNWFFGYAMR